MTTATDEIEQAETQKERRDADAELLQQRDQNRRRHHERRVEHIDGGNHARAAIRAGPGLHGRECRHDEQAAGDREADHRERDIQSARAREDGVRTDQLGRRRHAVNGEAEIERKDAEQHAADQSRQQHNAAAREPGGEAGADRDRDGKDREIIGADQLVAAEQLFHHGRQQRQDDHADQPEPARHQRAPPQSRIAAQMLNQLPRRRSDIFRHNEMRRAFAGAWNEQAAKPAQNREGQDQSGENRRMAAVFRRDAAGDRAQENGDKGRAFDQRIAFRQFAALQMIGQDSVFDRPKQRTDDAEAKQRNEQNDDRVQREAGNRNDRNADFDKLEPLRDQSLVIAVCDLAADRGQEEIRRDENRAGERDQRPAICAAELIQDEKRQRVLEKIVVERGKELRPEQRREAPRQHQKSGFRVHDRMPPPSFAGFKGSRLAE